MDNIKALSKMPVDAYNILLKYFLENTTIQYDKWSPDHYAYQIPFEDKKELRKLFPLRPKDIHLYKILPNSISKPHLDRGRRSCLQIPCNTNPGFKTFSQKNNVKLKTFEGKKHRPAKENEIIVTLPNGPLWFEYEEEKVETYITDLPYIQNVEKAHGGINSTLDVDRYLWSASYLEEFDYVCDAYKDWS